eukprot:SAG22_NODE_1604_length_4014_cov_2.392082_1_plen_1102_part_10
MATKAPVPVLLDHPSIEGVQPSFTRRDLREGFKWPMFRSEIHPEIKQSTDAVSATIGLSPDLWSDQHLFRMEWKRGPEGYLIFIIDGVQQWLAELCETLPADYLVDHLRVWQKEGHENIGCDPSDYPTKAWIHHHHEDYQLDKELAALDDNLPVMEEPLKYVNAGGSACTTIVQCGHGVCVKGSCECENDWTGPRCLAQAAGPSKHCQAVTAITTHSGCRAPRGLVVNRVPQLELLIDGQCSLLRSAARLDAQGPAAQRAADVCDQIFWNGTFGECSSEMRADMVLQAWFDLTGGQQCCGRLGSMISVFDKYNASLYHFSCTDVQSFGDEILYCVLGILCSAALGLVLRLAPRSCRRRDPLSHATDDAPANESQTEHPVDMQATSGASQCPQTGRLVENQAPMSKQEQIRPSELVDTMNDQEFSDWVAQIMTSVSELFGFQPDNFLNQREHLLSLMRSQSVQDLQHDCRRASALKKLHSRQFAGFQSWKSKLVKQTPKLETDNAEPLELMSDLCLYWCIWGEAGNVRFAPELLLFIFAAAKAHYADQLERNTRHNPYGQHGTCQGGEFLIHIIRPIYTQIFEETYSGLGPNGWPQGRYSDMAPPTARNYDDYNEMFWDVQQMLTLSTTDDVAVLSATLDGRVMIDEKTFSKLHQVSWQCRKTHAEVHSWAGVAAGYSRILVLHALTFVFLLLCVYRPDSRIPYACAGLIAPTISLSSQIVVTVVFGNRPTAARREVLESARALVHFSPFCVASIIVLAEHFDETNETAPLLLDGADFCFMSLCCLSLVEMMIFGPALERSTAFERSLRHHTNHTMHSALKSVWATAVTVVFWLVLFSAKMILSGANVLPAVVGADRLANSLNSVDLESIALHGLTRSIIVKCTHFLMQWCPVCLAWAADTMMWMWLMMAIMSTIYAVHHGSSTLAVACMLQTQTLGLVHLPRRMCDKLLSLKQSRKVRRAADYGSSKAVDDGSFTIEGDVDDTDEDCTDASVAGTDLLWKRLNNGVSVRLSAEKHGNATRNTKEEATEYLSGLSMFSDLVDPSFIDDLAGLIVPERIQANSWVVSKGDIGDKMWFIREGRVEIRAEKSQAAFVVKGAGDCFG